MSRSAPQSAAGRTRLRRWIIGFSVLAALAILAGWRLTATRSSAPEPVVAAVAPTPAPEAPAASPATASETSPGTPPAPPAEPSVSADAAASQAAPAAAAAPAAPELPPLTSVEVAVRPVHEVPPEKNPPPPDSTALDMTRPPPGYAGRRPSEGSTQPAPKQFAGVARVTGATSLTVGAIPVQLFGVKPPLPGDRCELGGVAMSCLDLAKKRLLERFGRSDQVNCYTPNPQPGMVVAFAICRDANGIDLGSFLLNEGLALADTGQSYDYVGAEGIARTTKHGLWKFR